MSERISLQEPLKVARYYYDLSEKAEWPETPYLRVILHSILRHLESQMNIPARTTSATPDASEEQPATTASPTTAGRSDVLDSPTARMMPLSLRLHCALTEAERTAVVNDLRLSALWDEFTGRLSMHVLAVESATSISQKLASSPSVETSASAAATSSSVSSEIPVFRGPWWFLQEYDAQRLQDSLNALQQENADLKQRNEDLSMQLDLTGNIEQQNIGVYFAAEGLLEIAKTGIHEGTYGGEKLEEAAQAILDLAKKAQWADDFIRHLRTCVELNGDPIDVIHTAVSAYERMFEKPALTKDAITPQRCAVCGEPLSAHEVVEMDGETWHEAGEDWSRHRYATTPEEAER